MINNREKKIKNKDQKTKNIVINTSISYLKEKNKIQTHKNFLRSSSNNNEIK